MLEVPTLKGSVEQTVRYRLQGVNRDYKIDRILCYNASRVDYKVALTVLHFHTRMAVCMCVCVSFVPYF